MEENAWQILEDTVSDKECCNRQRSIKFFNRLSILSSARQIDLWKYQDRSAGGRGSNVLKNTFILYCLG